LELPFRFMTYVIFGNATCAMRKWSHVGADRNGMAAASWVLNW